MPPIFAAVKGVVVNGNKFLILKDRDQDLVFWDLPGGKIDYGESPYDTLLREVKEETNLDVEIKEPLGMFWIIRKKDKGQVIYTVFHCIPRHLNIDLSKNPAVEQISEHKWVTKDEFLSEKYVTHNKSFKELIKNIEI